MGEASRAGAVAAVGGSLVAAGVALGVPPLAAVTPYAYLGAAVALGAAWSRRPERLLELGLWLWVLAPGVRRAVDLATGYHENSVVLLAPPLVALLGGVVVLVRWAGLVPRWGPGPGPVPDRRFGRVALRLAVLAAFGGLVALAVGRGPVAIGLAGVQLLSPLALGLLAATLVEPARRLAVLDRFATGVALLVGGYGVVQFVVAPPWDAQWLRDVDDVAQSFGRPFPLQIRVFSTVNDPGSLAVVLTFALLWLLVRRRTHLVGQLALVVGAACLALTLVRSAWIALAVAVAYVIVRGWVRPGRVVVAVAALAALLTVAGTVAEPVVQRFTSSTSSGASDESFQARAAFAASQLGPALTSPVGEGLGSTGTAVRRDSGGDQRFANTDSGYLEALRTWGGPLGLVLLLSLLAAVASLSWRVAPGARGAAAFLATVPVQLIFSGVWTGTAGVLFWVCLAALAGPGADLGPGVGDHAPPRFLRGRRRATSTETSETLGTSTSRSPSPEARVNSSTAASASSV